MKLVKAKPELAGLVVHGVWLGNRSDTIPVLHYESILQSEEAIESLRSAADFNIAEASSSALVSATDTMVDVAKKQVATQEDFNNFNWSLHN